MFSNLHQLLLLGVLLLLCSVLVNGLDDDDRRMHPDLKRSAPIQNRANPLEETIDYWHSNAQRLLSDKVQMERALNENKAKNIIMFLGDGMSLPTVAATRMYVGGEEQQLSFEKFPHFGLAKTYCVNRQVADSACTATAYLHGVKANYGTMGINAKVPRYDCDGDQDATKHTHSIAKWAQDNCKATGIVTTSRVTHATPGGIYAHTANRDWENDQEVRDGNCDPERTIDIARQMIESDVGKKLKVVLGGGRREFRDHTMVDEEGQAGYRYDGRDLIEEWLDERSKNGKTASFVWNEQALKSIDFERTDYLMGLFEADHCMFNIEIENNKLTEVEPSLTEMTEAAIRLLQKEEEGYFLFVESARIDMAHHETWAHKALDETKEFSRVIEMARRMTNESDTLIIVTSDHAHVMSYNGYPHRGNDILGISGQEGSDNVPYTTLSYANGVGYYNTYENGVRKDVSQLNFQNPDLEYMATAPRLSETHGGDDVGVYASGPWSHLFIGNYEQNNIPIAMAFAAKIGPYSEDSEQECNGVPMPKSATWILILAFVIRFMFR